MNDRNTRRTLLPKLNPDAGAAIASGLLALGAVALIAYGIAMIYLPAGVIAGGVALAVLQWYFFGGR
jgi:hypothetical protein